MEEALVGYLLADAGIAALVGDRIFWEERPQASALPSITLTIVDSAPVHSDEGADALNDATVQIDCWAADAEGKSGSTLAKIVGRAVVAALGVSFQRDGITFEGVFQDSGRDSPPETAAGNVKVFRRSLDYDIWHSG